MRCWECRFEIDEINESQPVCPGCGRLPNSHGDHPDFSAVLEEAGKLALQEPDAEDDDFDADPAPAAIPLPIHLKQASDDVEGLLEATGLAAFYVAGEFRLFRLPTERVM